MQPRRGRRSEPAPVDVDPPVDDREVALARVYNLAPAPRVQGVPDWSPALWTQRIEVDLSDEEREAYQKERQIYTDFRRAKNLPYGQEGWRMFLIHSAKSSSQLPPAPLAAFRSVTGFSALLDDRPVV